MPGNTVTVVEAGKLINIDQNRLRKGDLVVLQAGDLVPADIALIEARSLQVDEFDITGEILPVFKQARNDTKLYMGSKVLGGMAKGMVIAAGEEAEYGKILAQKKAGTKPFPFQLFKPRYLFLVILLLPALVIKLVYSNGSAWVVAQFLLGALGLILLQNETLFRSILIAAELKRAGRYKIHIKTLDALAKLSEIDLVCFDKTGVLTTRLMEVKVIHFADGCINAVNLPGDEWGKGILPLVRTACALCNDVQFYEKREHANPVDKALMGFAEKNGADIESLLMQYQRIYDLPFTSENRYMACGFERDGKMIFFMKGDVEVVLGHCRVYTTLSGVQKKMDEKFRGWIIATMEEIIQRGDTTIALAYSNENHAGNPGAYTFLCLIQLENPLQPGAHETILGLKNYGIRSLLLTGDRAAPAIKVSTDCGITAGTQACLTGRIMERMEGTEIIRQAEYCSVFARLLPSQKGYLIRLFQRQGRRVAMVGDGLNDSIALKVADVGISFVGSSSPIAQQQAKILIGDLRDVLRLVGSAHRIERRARYLKAFRIMIIFISLFSFYVTIVTG